MRSHQRQTLLRVRFRAHSRSELVAVYCGDVLQGGAFIRTRRVPPLLAGTRVEVCFELEDGCEVLRGQAVVAWLQRDPGRSGVGLFFVDLEPDSAELHQEMLRARGDHDRGRPRSRQSAVDEFCDAPTCPVPASAGPVDPLTPPPLPPLPRGPGSPTAHRTLASRSCLTVRHRQPRPVPRAVSPARPIRV